MLGNDFIPHFPAISIRTNGIDYLMDAYAETLGSKSKTIIDNNKINWKHFRLFVEYLKNNERVYIQHEYKMKSKKRHYKTDTLQDIQFKFLNIPTIDRSLEFFIDPDVIPSSIYLCNNKYNSITGKLIRTKQAKNGP